MPIYEYACDSCEHRFETIQRVSEEPLRDCPECGDKSLKKLLSAPGSRIKGSGRYETHFKTRNKKDKLAAEAGRLVGLLIDLRKQLAKSGVLPDSGEEGVFSQASVAKGERGAVRAKQSSWNGAKPFW